MMGLPLGSSPMSLLLLSLGACSTEAAPEVCEVIPRPEMALSETELDFGDVLIGSTATRTVLLSNTGNYPLGVTSVAVGDADEGSDFVVSYDVAGTDCASVPDDAYDREIPDTGLRPWDTGTETHWSGHAFVLEPGCALPLTVTYTPTAYYTDADALIVTSDNLQDVPESGFHAAVLHGSLVTWLRGNTTLGADPLADPYIVGDTIRLGQSTLLEGDTIELEVRVEGGAAPLSYSWSTDAGGFDANQPAVTFTGPHIDACATDDLHQGWALNLYALVWDAEGNQDWAANRAIEWEEGLPLYEDCPEVDTADEDCPVEEPTGCGGGAAALVWVFGGLGLSVRRRRPAQRRSPHV